MMAMGLIGGLVGAFGAIQQAMYQKAVADANAKQAKLNAKLAGEVSQQEAEDLGTEGLGLSGELLSGQAASGLALTSPSAVRSRIWMGRVGYKDQLRRVEAGNREAANYRTQANVFKAEGRAAMTAGIFNAVGSVIGGISGMGGGSGGSFLGNAQPTRMSPGYLPVPAARNRLYSSLSIR